MSHGLSTDRSKCRAPHKPKHWRFMLHSLLATSCVVFNKHTEIDNLMKCEEAGGGCKKATEMMAADWNAIKDLTNLSDELLASFVGIEESGQRNWFAASPSRSTPTIDIDDAPVVD